MDSRTDPRLRRLEGPGRRYFLLALDHGLPAGPLPGIERPADLVRSLRGTPITGVILNPGLVPRLAREFDSTLGLVVHLSAGTRLGAHPTAKIASSSVEQAVAIGADAVSVQVHFGAASEDRMLTHAGAVVDDATRLGVPVLVMAYAPAAAGEASSDSDATRHAVRAAAEVGASLVQTSFAGGRGDLEGIVRGCPVPVLLAGGPDASSEDAWLDAIRAGLGAGAAGACVGRNLFRHDDSAGFARRIGETVFGTSVAVTR
ncbi:MAG: class I fructose-bisphosphate aldolase [Methanobacteriota archaeon]